MTIPESFLTCDVRFWHLVDNPTAPALSAIGPKQTKGGFDPKRSLSEFYRLR
jgi:hypothetical protein